MLGLWPVFITKTLQKYLLGIQTADLAAVRLAECISSGHTFYKR